MPWKENYKWTLAWNPFQFCCCHYQRRGPHLRSAWFIKPFPHIHSLALLEENDFSPRRQGPYLLIIFFNSTKAPIEDNKHRFI